MLLLAGIMQYYAIWDQLCVIAPTRIISGMPTSGDLKSGDFSFITPWHRTTPPKKKAMTPSPNQIDPHTPKST